VSWLRETVAPDANLSTDSRRLGPGDVFCAYRGAAQDGRRFIGDAIARGAKAVLFDPAEGFGWEGAWDLAHRAEPLLKERCGVIAAHWYGVPSKRLAVIAVTGTSGKSSTALWIARSLEALGRRAAFIGTLGAGALDALADTGNTTPDPVLLQRLLAQFAAQGLAVVAMEVSSIGLEEGRVNGTHFQGAVFSNLSHDHLDYHGTMGAYEAAKARLFAWPDLKFAVVNLDDDAGPRIAQAARRAGARVLGYGVNEASAAPLRAANIRYRAQGMEFDVQGFFGTRFFATELIGTYNVSNLLAVAGVLLSLDVDIDAALAAMQSLKAPAGRLEQVPSDQGPMVLVDYAHKPDALEKALKACRPLAEARGGRLIAVFGCGGDRDPGKRPIMGRIASELADTVFVTNDNPRSEDPATVAEAILKGAVAGRPKPILELDRRQAIARAIGEAQPCDLVLVAGKGHETYQEMAGKKLPFSDVDEARLALEKRHKGAAC
jgi:UDP-N-acetylmuramoyl-L-alanyl-D-glutamate--2,6-diaminopimelate ligase